MIWEGHDQPDLLQNGLAVARAIHDRYHAALRNPYNEIECSDHYARAMASFGAFQAACGFECHGPKGHVALAPRLSPDNFRAPFTTAGAWGTFTQTRTATQHTATLTPKWGRLRVRTLTLTPREGFQPKTVAATVNDQSVRAALSVEEDRVSVTLESQVNLEAAQSLTLELA
jgi:hypothetical protein